MLKAQVFIIWIFCLFCSFNRVFSVLQLKYATSFVGNSSETVISISSDSQDGLAISGLTFSPDLQIYDLNGNWATQIVDNNDRQFFIVKYFGNGTFHWARFMNCTFGRFTKIQFDKSDNLLVSGYNKGQDVDVYDPQGNKVASISVSGFDYDYQLKFSNDGSFIWSTRQEYPITFDNTFKNLFDVDQYGNIYTSGRIDAGFVVFYNSDGSIGGNQTQIAVSNFYGAKYNSAGYFQYLVPFTVEKYLYTLKVYTDPQGNFYLSGIFAGFNATFFDKLGVFAQIINRSDVGESVFIAKYNTSGGLTWLSYFESLQDIYDFDLSFDVQGNVYGAAQSFSNFTLYDSIGNSTFYQNQFGITDIVVFKLNRDGKSQWSFKMNGNSDVSLSNIRVDNFGNINLAGLMHGDNLNVYGVDGQLLTTFNKTYLGNMAWFIYCLNSSGGYVSFFQISPYTDIQSSDGFEFLADKRITVSGIVESAYFNFTDTNNTQFELNVLNSTNSSYNDVFIAVFQDLDALSLITTAPQSSASMSLSTSITATQIELTSQSNLSTAQVSASSSPVYQESTFVATSTQLIETSVSFSSSLLLVSQKNTTQFSTIVNNINLTNPFSTSNSDGTLSISLSGNSAGTQQSLDSAGSSTLVEPVLTQNQIGEILLTPLALSIISVLAVIVLLLLLYIVFRRRQRQKSTTTNSILGYTDSTTFTNVRMIESTNMQTLNVTSQPLSIPLYLKSQFGFDFRPRDLIAQGGLGSIYFCEVLSKEMIQRVGYEKVIVKVIKDSQSTASETIKSSFYQELSMYSKFMQFEGFAKIYAYSDEPFAIVMKYYQFGSLDSFIHSNSLMSHPFDKATVVNILKLFAISIKHMVSNGFVHLDIKPDNILLDVNEHGQLIPIVTDFGISKLFDLDKNLVQAFKLSNIKGLSVKYSAPELFLHYKNQNQIEMSKLPACDIYAIGVLIQEMIQRKKPWSW